MKILAFDTSSAVSAVAMLVDDQVVFADASASEAKHGATLLPRIEAALAAAGLKVADLSLVAVGLGPGSFTGLRVGLATAKGFALARAVPLCGVGSLPVLAGHIATPDTFAAVVTNAHRGEVFAAMYALDEAGLLQEKVAPFAAPPESAVAILTAAGSDRPLRLCGDGLGLYPEVFAPLCELGERVVDGDLPRAECLARQAKRLFQDRGSSRPDAMEPLYLRGSDARLPDRPLEL